MSLNPRRLAFLSDEKFLQLKYYDAFGYFMDFKNPKTFNEKLQWLKIYNRKPEYTTVVDKYNVKKYIADKIGEEYIIPTIGAWDRFDDIDFDALPNQFVLKCTHDSGGLIVCTDKSKLNIDKAKKIIETSLSNNYYYMGREWPYKNVVPRIIAEQYMGENLRNYKKLGLDDKSRLVLVYSERVSQNKFIEEFYDEIWRYRNIDELNCETPIFVNECPKQYKVMREVGSKLFEQIQYSRIDFYEIDNENYLGEITLCGDRRFETIKPEKFGVKPDEWTEVSETVYRLKFENLTLTLSIFEDKEKEAKGLIDYKFFCFNGLAESVMVCTERETGNPKFYFFNKEWELKRYNKRGKKAPTDFTLPKPDCMDEMFLIAERLSQDIPYVRVDLYCIDSLIYFGEMTFYPDSGLDANLLTEVDKYWGDMLELPIE